mgnify:CR=1 FL=1
MLLSVFKTFCKKAYDNQPTFELCKCLGQLYLRQCEYDVSLKYWEDADFFD